MAQTTFRTLRASDCPDPRSCPVPSPSSVDLRHLRTVALETGEPFFTAFSARQWPTLFNRSAKGRSRFAPQVDSAGAVVPTLYGARTTDRCALGNGLPRRPREDFSGHNLPGSPPAGPGRAQRGRTPGASRPSRRRAGQARVKAQSARHQPSGPPSLHNGLASDAPRPSSGPQLARSACSGVPGSPS